MKKKEKRKRKNLYKFKKNSYQKNLLKLSKSDNILEEKFLKIVRIKKSYINILYLLHLIFEKT